jgi:hypothetical protein
MEPTTTSGDQGVAAAPADVTQPTQTPAAVTLGEQGAPVLRPRTAPTSTPQSQTNDAEVAAPAEPTPGDNQPAAPAEVATDSTDDLDKFAQAKGYDPAALSDGERKALEMARNAEKKMHEATAKSKELETTMVRDPNLEYTGNEAIDNLALQVNQMNIQNRVRDFFEANPGARDYESKMAELVQQRPWLQNDLEALHALAVNSPDRAAELKSEGGREALTNLAQKQSAVPPPSNASTGVSSSSDRITPENVDDLVAKNGQEWFKKHYSEINRAMAGTR